MPKKFAAVFILLLTMTGSAHAYDTGHTDKGYFQRVLMAEKRGILNAVGLPLELVRTPIAESGEHKWLWPVTFFPRFLTNVFGRTVSAVNDILIAPLFYYPFSDDMTPFTEPLGLPEYPWQIN